MLAVVQVVLVLFTLAELLPIMVAEAVQDF
jgi:hypothetical protein